MVLKGIEKYFYSKTNAQDGDNLECLTTLAEVYENQHFYISPPYPIEAIKFRMDQLRLK